MNIQKNLWLNGLRGLGCLIVMTAHLGAISKNYGIYFNGCGKIGVWLFMVLGAFWFIYPIKKLEKNITLCTLGKYYLTKCIRLYVPYFAAVIFSFFIRYITDLSDVLNHLLLLENRGHFWYMPVIFKFFFVAPVFWIINNIINKDCCVLIIYAIIGLGMAFFFPYKNYPENSTCLQWYLPVFLMGMTIGIVFYKLEVLENNRYFGDICAAMIILVVISLMPLFRQVFWDAAPSDYLQNKYLLIGGLWCACIISLETGIYGKKILSHCSILQILGDISYPLYLVHYPIITIINMLKIPWFGKTIIALSASLTIAWLLHFYIEEPCVKLLNKRK